MEENVALDSKKQKKFLKSIKGIKKLIKANKSNEESVEANKDEIEKPQKPFSMRLKNNGVHKRKRKNMGLVYLSHIPHGFYEHQMTEYFKQFGVVTNVRVIRSKRTGNSKGYAFVEFKEPSVAQIVAETMNNYLMGKRLIKAAYIPPEKQRKAFRKHWNTKHNPASESRLKFKKAYNADKDENDELKRARNLLASLNKTKRKLSEIGVNYDFFTPVDIPDALLDTIIKKEEDDKISTEVEYEKNFKKEKKGQKLEVDNKNVKNKNEKKSTEDNKTEKTSTNNKNKNTKSSIMTEAEKAKVLVEVTKKEKVKGNIDKQEQIHKQQKMKDAGVKFPEDFMKVDDSPDDSDNSYVFDSDSYEKILENDDDDISSGENESDGNEDDGEESEDSEHEIFPKQIQSEQVVTPKQVQGKQSAPKFKQLPVTKKQGIKLSQEIKREAEQNFQGSPKKLKFEKQNQKPMKKQFKKK